MICSHRIIRKVQVFQYKNVDKSNLIWLIFYCQNKEFLMNSSCHGLSWSLCKPCDPRHGSILDPQNKKKIPKNWNSKFPRLKEISYVCFLLHYYARKHLRFIVKCLGKFTHWEIYLTSPVTSKHIVSISMLLMRFNKVSDNLCTLKNFIAVLGLVFFMNFNKVSDDLCTLKKPLQLFQASFL